MKVDIANEMLFKNVLLNIDIIESIRRGKCNIIFASARGVLIYDTKSGIYMMSALDIQTAEEIILKIPKDIDIIVTHQNNYCDLLMKKFGLEEEVSCYNVLYKSKEKINVYNDDIDIRRITDKYKEYVKSNYSSLDKMEKGYIEKRINEGEMYGAFMDSTLCGFVGSHEEGSIGILEVLPRFRKRGIALKLEAFAINLAIEQGRYPYGQVFQGNEPSLNLQNKLGFEKAKEKTHWLVRKE
ncbi:MAG: GNAT family N-acetyltransferase [Clostridium sp.]|nr:GNAT family N-acetyltransferase [Clostridium sp.]